MKNFHDLIEELGGLLGIELHVDLNQSCSVEMNQSITVQMELDSPGETILFLCFIVELPPGKFRESVLKDGLKANFLAEDKLGVLSYVERENALVLCHTVYTHSLMVEQLKETLLRFYERAKNWQDAINSGRTAPESEIPPSSNKKSSIFGFK